MAYFCENYILQYTNITVGYIASELRILQILEKISSIEGTTFRALVKPKKIGRYSISKFISIFRKNYLSNDISITDAFSLDITGDSLIILRVTKGLLDSNSFPELFVISIVQDVSIVWNNIHIYKIKIFHNFD